MKVILLYGPPAVGKLTIARVLSKLTGISVFHNHMMLNPLREIFGLDNPIRAKLEYEFRLRILDEAIQADKDLIMTGVMTMKNYREFYEKVIQKVEASGGQVYLVQLSASKDVLRQRVIEEHRKQTGKIDSLEQWNGFAQMYPEMYERFTDKEHLMLNTTAMVPQEAANKIVAYYHLP